LAEQEEIFENSLAAERYVRLSIPELELLAPLEAETFIFSCGVIIELKSSQKNTANSRAILGSFVVRNENLYSLQNFLKIVEAGTKLLSDFSGAASLVGWGAISASLLDIYNIFNAIREKGFELNEAQLVLFTLIKDSGPLHADSMRQSIPRNIADLDIEELLSPLVISDANPNGVLQNKDGVWFAIGV